jgi:two-component system, NtrC family, response regulator AlgB
MRTQRAGTPEAASHGLTEDWAGCQPLLVSRDSRTAAVLQTAARAAAGDTTILLLGESGTGKDILARQIHKWSPRRGGPFVTVNCSALTDQFAENELFGHVRGAFSGAVNETPGRLEAGHGGTVYFNEVAGLTAAVQAQLLRFVEERCFERVGGNATIKVDVRILAASSHDLEAEVAAGRFRQDLLYRLNVITLRLPPLRERAEDILPLAEWLLKQMCARTGRPELHLSPKAAELLTRCPWPGNVRELRNALERAAALATGDMITRKDLPESIRYFSFGEQAAVVPETGLKASEREQILRALATSPTLVQAAATLGIDVSTLWRKRKHYGID